MGKPFSVIEYGREECISKYREWLVAKFQTDPSFLRPLVGKDLVCYCKPEETCHADVLIDFVILFVAMGVYDLPNSAPSLKS
jgi:hypothetical protein